MRGSIRCAAAVVILLSTQAFGEEEKTSASPVLISDFKLLMTEVFKLMKADRRLPHDISQSELDKRTESAVAAYRKLNLFEATPEEEKRFAAGKFDDAKNTEQLKEMLEFLKSTKIEMPTTTVYAMNQLQAGNLKGLRLELCLRLVKLNVGTLKSLGGGN